MTVAGIFVFREPTKIWHVDGEGGEETDDDIEGSHCGPASIEARSKNDGATDKRSTAVSDNCAPEEEGQECRGDNDGLETEEVAKSVHGKTGDCGLDNPIEEDHKKGSTSDVGTGWKFVGEIVIGRPDSGHHVLKIATSLNSRDGRPLSSLAEQSLSCAYHESDESTDKDGGNATPHTEGDTGDDGKGSMIHSADTTKPLAEVTSGTVRGETNNTTTNQEAEEANWDRLTSREANTHNGGDGGPERRRKHVAAP